ncbi:hypothetical protein EDF56_101193 [Novosphingobium sp. PhB165]|nr:hypothetical protein EDF56_101193 [Novosphingobium sp. PhB165]
MKPPCFHRRDQTCGSCGFPLQVTYTAPILSPMAEGEQNSEFKAANSGAAGEDIPGTNSHVTPSPPAQHREP